MVLELLKSDLPGMFCLIILQPESVSKICMTLFDQVARDGISVLTSWKVSSGGRVDIENDIEKSAILQHF